MTYHEYAFGDNVVTERDHALEVEGFIIKIFKFWLPIFLVMVFVYNNIIRRIMHYSFVGPVSDNVLKRFLQWIIFVFTRRYVYYQVPTFARDESRFNIFLHNDFARLDRNTLNGYCNICNLYGHTDTDKHNPTIDALVLAKTCKLIRYNDKVTKPLAYTVHNIRAYEKNTKAFVETFGTNTTNIPTKYALAPKKAVCELTTIASNLGPIYVNNTIAYPHLGFIAYDNKQHLQELLANLTIVLDTLMVYTQYELDDTTINIRKSNILLTFVKDFDLTHALNNELKDPRTPWLLKAKKGSNKSTELEDDTEAEDNQKSKRKGKVGEAEKSPKTRKGNEAVKAEAMPKQRKANSEAIDAEDLPKSRKGNSDAVKASEPQPRKEIDTVKADGPHIPQAVKVEKSTELLSETNDAEKAEEKTEQSTENLEAVKAEENPAPISEPSEKPAQISQTSAAVVQCSEHAQTNSELQSAPVTVAKEQNKATPGTSKNTPVANEKPTSGKSNAPATKYKQTSKRKGKQLTPQTQLLNHTLANQNRPARIRPYLRFGPTFMSLLFLTSVLIPTQAMICTRYVTVPQSDQYCEHVQDLTIANYHAYANYEHLNSKCFSTDGAEFKDLIRLSVSNVLNLSNVIKPIPKDDYILKAFSDALPLKTHVLSDFNTKLDLQILMQFYNLSGSNVVYAENYSESEDYAGKVVQLLAQSTGDICDKPTCILFTGLETTPKDVEVKVTERLMKRVKHQEHGKQLIINPSCSKQCECMNKPTIEPEIKETVKFAPLADFYTQLSYFQNYELRMYDDFDMGVLRYNNYTLTTFVYNNATCLLNLKHRCVYNPEHFEITRVYNDIGNYLECGVNQEFCESLQQEFTFSESDLVITENPSVEAPIRYYEICNNHYTALQTKYPLIEKEFWTNFAISIKNALVGKEPATFIIVHDSETVVKSVIADMIAIAEECYESTALKLTHKDFNVIPDYSDIIAKYHPLISKQKIVLIEDIDLITVPAIRSLFSYFDTYTPAVKDAFILCTLNHKRYTEVLALNLYNDQTPTSYVEGIFKENWKLLDDKTLIPLIVRVTDNVQTILAYQVATPPAKLSQPMPEVPTLNNTSKVINTFTHYSAHILRTVGDDSTQAYNYLNNSVNNITDYVSESAHDFYDYVNDALKLTKRHILKRYRNMLMAYYDIQRNFHNSYPIRQDFYQRSVYLFDSGRICDYLHHSDTIVLYQDCIREKLDTIYVIKLRYGQPANAFHVQPLEPPHSKQHISALSEAIGFEYQGHKYNYYRTLFTNPDEYALTIRENYLEYCKSEISPTPAFTPNATLQCFAYITGFKVIDSFIAEFGLFLVLYIAALIIILAVAITIRDNTGIMLLKQFLIFAYIFGPWLLTPKVYGSYILVKLYNLIPYTSSTSYGCLLAMATVAITIIDVIAYMTQRYRPELTKHFLQVVTMSFEAVAITRFILLPYIFTSYGFVLTIIASYVAYRFVQARRPNYLKSSVSNATAHADWVAYRNTTREKTDEAAKSNLSKIINTNVADIKKEQLLECLYLAACHQATVAAQTYNPKHYLHIPNYNTRIMFARDNELMNYSAVQPTKLKNKSAASNPSISHIVLELPVAINPLIKYTTKTSVSSLRGAIVNGYIYIQRHLFGSKKQEFEACYNNGKGLLNCHNLERSKYDIDSAELIGTLIRIPLINKNAFPHIKLHPAPLTYNGPVTLYLSRYDTELQKDVLCVHTGFISEGHHDIKTVFGDCGGMLFDPKGRLLGLHCAGSDDVVFMDLNTQKSNIWTSYKLQHPSEIMITLNSEINLPNPKNYDFETSKVVYHHPLRNVGATLETLQHLTNKTNAKMPYDPRLLSDFNITAEQYAHHGYNVDYNNFISNFNRYTTTTIGTKSFETCIKYGLMDNKNATYHNQNTTSVAIVEKYSCLDYIMDVIYVLLYMFTHTHPAYYIAAFCVFCLFFVKMNKYLKMILINIILMLPDLYLNYYYSLLYLPLKWRCEIYHLIRHKAYTTSIAVRYNENLTIAKDLAKELGTPKNLCTHLATILKCIKPYAAFSDLSQVVNNVDDLMANWVNIHNASELLKEYIDEIYKLYPILFVVFEKIETVEDQIKTVLSYINDTGEFDLNGFEIHFDEKEHTTNIIDPNAAEIYEKLMVEKASFIALKNMNSEFNINSINEASIGELVRYLIISSTPETLDRELLARTTELLVRQIHNLRDNNDHNENLIALLSEIYKHKDFLTASHLTSNLRDRNYIMNNLVRVIALFNKQINMQVAQKQYEARRVENERKKESKQIMEQNNRIRKMQRQNQNIASAIVHMVHACFANRFMLKNEAQLIMKELATYQLNLDPSDAEMIHYESYQHDTVLTNKSIQTNFTTLSTILWTGNGYQTVPSMCGDHEFTCTASHKHGYFNCTMEIKDDWYNHVENCDKCRSYYKQRKHPRCPNTYDPDTKRFPTLSNFIARYRSCPCCLPCTSCLSKREPTCTINSYHVEDTAYYKNEAYLTPLNIKPDNLTYDFTSPDSGDINANYNGRIWLMRRSTPATPPQARYRHITNLKLQQADPEGYYYLSEHCPTDLAILNAMINQIQVKLQERSILNNENASEELNNYIKFTTPPSDATLSDLRDKHTYLLVMRLRPDSEHHLLEVVNYVNQNQLPTFIVHVTNDTIENDHATLYVSYMQVWRREIIDNIDVVCDILSKVNTQPLDFPIGRVL
ncbi:ORF1 [Karang Sari virus]|uniref:ORF1 n=1 Tax=Karang Sari virus TaxID=1332248 RepID=X2CBX4_9NIDO|nr:ORF1 [Karang Sari virus]AGL73188.1 ORF1 [Karang Sari virus]